MENDRLHKTKFGKTIPISEMATDHIVKTIAWIDKRMRDGFKIKGEDGRFRRFFGDDVAEALHRTWYAEELDRRDYKGLSRVRIDEIEHLKASIVADLEQLKARVDEYDYHTLAFVSATLEEIIKKYKGGD